MKKMLLLLLLSLPLKAAPPDSFFHALHLTETGGKLGATIGDRGAALGPLQIHRDYWRDSRIPGNYEQCADLAYSVRVVSAYLKRYAPKAWESGNLRTLAFIHNGGPQALKAKGRKLANLVIYWRKVESNLKQ